MIVVVVGAIKFVAPLYRSWRAGKSVEQAAKFEAQRDYRSAFLALRQATDTDPGNLHAWAAAVKFLGDVGSPDVLFARQEMIKIAPQDISLRLALVSDALKLGRIETARDTLATIDAASRKPPEFHRLAATIALAAGKKDELEAHLAESVRLEPGNLFAQFNLAALRLWGPDEGTAKESFEQLEGLSAKPGFRVRSAVEMLRYEAQYGDRRAVDQLVDRLLKRLPLLPPTAKTPTARDDFNEPPGWFELLARLRHEASSDATDAAILLDWFGSLKLNREALAWADTLPPTVGQNMMVKSARANLAAELGDQEWLRRLLAEQAWGPISLESLDLAFAAHWQKAKFTDARGKATWEDAITSADSSPMSLRVLSRLANAWQEADFSERALQAVLQKYPNEQWAYETLRNVYAARAEGEKLWQLYSVWAKRAVQDRVIQSTYVRLSILLNHMTPEVSELAHTLHDKEPSDTYATVNYAASLWRQSRTRDGLKTMETLSTKDKSDPRTALFYAAMLYDGGYKEQARMALGHAATGQLVGDERKLLQQVAQRLDYALPAS